MEASSHLSPNSAAAVCTQPLQAPNEPKVEVLPGKVQAANVQASLLEKPDQNTPDPLTAPTPTTPLPQRSIISKMDPQFPPLPFEEGSPEYQLDRVLVNTFKRFTYFQKVSKPCKDSIKTVMNYHNEYLFSEKGRKQPTLFRNNQFIVALARLRWFMGHDEYQEVIRDFIHEAPDSWSDYADAIQVAIELEEPSTADNYEKALALAYKTQYPPLVWQLLKQAMKKNQCVLSPSKVFPLLLKLDITHEINLNILTIMVAVQQDQQIFRYISDKTTPQGNESQMLALLLGHFLCNHTESEKVSLPILGDTDRIKLQTALKCIAIALYNKPIINRAMNIKAKNLQQSCFQLAEKTVLLNLQDKPKQAQQALTLSQNLVASKSRAQLAQMETQSWFQKCMKDLLESTTRCENPYAADCMRLVQAWYYHADLVSCKRNTQLAAVSLYKCATGSFPLLFLDAAVVFARAGYFDHALKSLKKLLERSDLPKTSALQARALTIMYEKRQEDFAAWDQNKQIHASSSPPKQIPMTKKTDAHKPAKTKKVATTEQPVPSVQKQNIQAKIPTTNAPTGTESQKTSATASPEPPSVREYLAEQKEEIGTSDKVNWLPDYDQAIQRFLGGLEATREKYAPREEAAYLNRHLKNQTKKPAIYARACEEACWFYLEQILSQVSTQYCYLLADLAEDDGTQISLVKRASYWLARAEFLYTGLNSTDEITLEQHKALTSQALKNMPATIDQQEYRKRLRALCSSRGHVHSALSMLPVIFNKKKHASLATGYYEYRESFLPSKAEVKDTGSEKLRVISKEEEQYLRGTSQQH